MLLVKEGGTQILKYRIIVKERVLLSLCNVDKMFNLPQGNLDLGMGCKLEFYIKICSKSAFATFIR